MNLHRKTLVLLHGHGADDTIWDNLDATLNESYTIVRPNISLFTFCQTVEEYADELHRFLTNAGITKFTLVGHSMGGYIALAFAEKYQDMLEGLCLFHSTAFADDDAKKAQRTQMIELLKNYGTASFIEKTAPNMFGERYKELFPGKLQEHIAHFSKLPAEALIAGLNAMRIRPDRTHVLASLPFPVLFIIGMQDKVLPFETLITLSEYPKKGYPFILAEAGHMGMVERPDATARMISWYMTNSEKTII
jgi:pimeloyl-ACP methyl ester carboxylesterase